MKRNSSIELLRIFATLSVCLLHFNTRGIDYSNGDTSVRLFLYYMEAISISAVNVFICISAFFLVRDEKRNLLKIYELIGQVVCISGGMYIVGLIVGKYVFSIRNIVEALLPSNYFVIFYCVIYVLSPYLNILLRNLTGEKRKRLILLCIILFSVYPTLVDFLYDFNIIRSQNLSTITRNGSTYGYSIVQFFLMYLIGATIGLTFVKEKKYNVKIDFVIYVFTVTLTAGLGYFVDCYVNGGKFTLGVVWSYCNPIIVVMAIVLLRMFSQLCFENEIVNKIAKASFTVYLVHPYLLSVIPYKSIENFNLVKCVGFLMIMIICVYAICYMLYLMWSLVLKIAYKMIDDKDKFILKF